MSTGRELMRVSDAERQAAAERLRAALGEGRLDLTEYDSRLGRAYAAVTYADLDQLFTDLPVHTSSVVTAVPSRAAPRPVPAVRSGFAGQPLPLKILWTIWSGVVLINLTVWLLLSLASGPGYFWPMWLLVPGAVLGGATVIVNSVRSHR